MSLITHNAERFYDINLRNDEKLLVFLSAVELARGVEKHSQMYGDDDCTKCHRRVAVWGFAEYEIDNDEIYRTLPMCKACYAYDRFGVVEEPPPCLCPEGAISGHKIDSSCPLHVVPAKQAVPFDIPRMLVPHEPSIMYPPTFNLLDASCVAWRQCMFARGCPVKSLRARSTADKRLGAISSRPYGTPAAGEARCQAREEEKKGKQARAAEANFFGLS
ncbi:hypothetical protein B0H19DRAFT_1256306 [Mycena capillaripes]|nr:hypothetical protein B0H19DRAFT_1256306 [Mycena capillaripes]